MNSRHSAITQNRCLQLYHHACESIVNKTYTNDLTQLMQKKQEMEQCSFRPSICQFSAHQRRFPQPNSFEATILRLRRGQELRTHRTRQLAPRTPMSRINKALYSLPEAIPCPDLSKTLSDAPIKKDPIVLVEVTKDCEKGGVSPVGILRVRLNDNIERLVYEFGKEYMLSRKQTIRLQEQLQVAINTLSNSQ